MTKIVVASGKGGVGKSMLASSLAMLFAQKKKIVAVDCDVDAPNLHLWLGQGEDWDETEPVLASEKAVVVKEKFAQMKSCPAHCPFGALTVEEGRLTVNHYLCEGCGACAALCPPGVIRMKAVENASIRLKSDVEGFPLVSAQLYPGESGSGKVVDRVLARAERFPFSLMIIDAPAGTGCPVIAAIRDANLAILVTEPTPSGLADLKRVLSVVDYFQIPYRVVINKWDVNRQMSKKIEKEFADRLLGKISYDQKIFTAIANLTPIITTDLKAKEEIRRIFGKLSLN